MINKRYLPPAIVGTFIKNLPKGSKVKTIGYSVQKRPISLVSIGVGNTKILLWSQMHGNESTTTKALFDFIPWFLDSSQQAYQKKFTLNIILQLNPDGASAYTRLNANSVDLNRDALKVSQPESKALQNTYNSFKPDYCLNLHGQRTLFSAGEMGQPASISFLAPSADMSRALTPARIIAMKCIVAIFKGLENDLPDQIGRYDDTFNPNCVGDRFTLLGTPTILFEAGHFPGDYQREVTRTLILKSFKFFFNALLVDKNIYNVNEYLNIPENSKDFVDLLVKEVNIIDQGTLFKSQHLGVRYEEKLVNGEICFIPFAAVYGDEIEFNAHRTITLPSDLKNIPVIFEVDKPIQIKEFSELFSIKL